MRTSTSPPPNVPDSPALPESDPSTYYLDLHLSTSKMTPLFHFLSPLRCHQNSPLNLLILTSIHTVHTYSIFLHCLIFYSFSQQRSLEMFLYAFYLYLCSSLSFLNQLQLGFYHPTPIKLISERSPMAMPVNYFNLTWEHLTPDISCLHESLSSLGPWHHSVLALLAHWLSLLHLLWWFLILLTVTLCKLLNLRVSSFVQQN